MFELLLQTIKRVFRFVVLHSFGHDTSPSHEDSTINYQLSTINIKPFMLSDIQHSHPLVYRHFSKIQHRS
ncbi:MAG: hypothetical protein SNJ66_04110, partial [Chloroherpetonaceae bacterium]